MNAREIIALWPSRDALAEDTGRSVITINSWHLRNRIAPDCDVAIVDAAKKRKIQGVTFETLARSRSDRAA